MTAREAITTQLEELLRQVRLLSEKVDRLTALRAGQPNFSQIGEVPLTAAVVQEIIAARRTREKMFGSIHFADPAWDIILSLMHARLSGERLTITNVCDAASAPPTTALRWIVSLEENYVITRSADLRDKRRVFLDVADQTADAFTAWYDASFGSPKR